MNTRGDCLLHFLMFKEDGEKEYTAVCYELSIVLTGNDVDKLKKEITRVAKNYVETVIEQNLSNSLLNQQHKLPQEYRDLFTAFQVDSQRSKKETTRLSHVIDKVVDARAFVEASPALQGA